MPVNDVVTYDTLKKNVNMSDGSQVTITCGDRFLWHAFKWYIVEIAKDEIIVRLEGTSDVATLPEMLVAELVEEFQLSSMRWR
jgi:hypothetical protein